MTDICNIIRKINNLNLKQILFILFISTGFNTYAQNFYLQIEGTNRTETLKIDSLQYSIKHTNLKSLFEEVNNTIKKLSKEGFLSAKTVENKQINDSIYQFKINLKERTKYTYIYIGRNINFFDPSEIKNDTLKIQYKDIENYLNQKIIDAEKSGFALTKVKLENIRKKNSIIYADLNFNIEKKRNINSVIINYVNSNRKDNFPKGHLKQINKKYTNRTFNQQTVKELYDDLNKYEFITQTKYPEILFTKDSTKIYTYLEKRKANTFDGYIGFTNNESKKINFNGYLDITLQNTIRAGEQFSLNWKSDGSQQTTFNTKLEIPYIFKTSFGVKAQINIFKQDSTFQNSKTGIDLGYYINYNTKLFLGYHSTESSDIQNKNSINISDFKNSYFTSTFEYKKVDPLNYLFPKKGNVKFIIGYGERKTNTLPETVKSSKQLYVNLDFSYNFELNNKNFININSENFYLNSQTYITNELYRFGGFNSIRGFSESSLQANFISSILTEYRYIVSKSLYLHSITDYAIYQDLTLISNQKKINKIIGLGLGTAMQTPNGLIKITLTNGTTDIQELQLYNTIINICYNVKF